MRVRARIDDNNDDGDRDGRNGDDDDDANGNNSNRNGGDTTSRQPTQSDVSAAIAKVNKALSPLDLAIRSARSQRDGSSLTYALVMLGTVDPLGQSQAQTQAMPLQAHSQITSQNASFGGGAGGSAGAGPGGSQAWPSPTTYTPDEQAFVRRVLDAIFETNNTVRAEVLAVKGMQAVRLHRAPPSTQQQLNPDQSFGQDGGGGTGAEWQNRQAQTIPMTQAERLMTRLVDEGWLERSEKAWYSLGARGLIELKEWLVETYNGVDDENEDEDEEEDGRSGRQKWERIKFCDACKEIITVVSSCCRALFL